MKPSIAAIRSFFVCQPCGQHFISSDFSALLKGGISPLPPMICATISSLVLCEPTFVRFGPKSPVSPAPWQDMQLSLYSTCACAAVLVPPSAGLADGEGAALAGAGTDDVGAGFAVTAGASFTAGVAAAAVGLVAVALGCGALLAAGCTVAAAVLPSLQQPATHLLPPLVTLTAPRYPLLLVSSAPSTSSDN